MSEERRLEGRTSALPDPNYLHALASASIGWRTALCEWIDNSFGHGGATSIQIEIGPSRKSRPQYLVITDNGRGCEDLRNMVVLGEHRKQSANETVSRYGVGTKDAALWVGGMDSTYSVRSTKGGTTRDLILEWGDLAVDWTFPDPTARPSLPGESGTKITIAPCCHPLPSDFDNLVKELGYLYLPALKRGRHISVAVKGRPQGAVPVEAWTPPHVIPDSKIDERIEVDGKTAHVVAGITREGENNDRRGVTYSHSFRVIRKATGDGCGGMDFTRVFCHVELDEKWRLNKNKNGVAHHAQELYEAVFKVLQPILARAESIGHTIESRAFLGSLETTLNRRLGLSGEVDDPDEKAVRGEGDETGTKNPKGTEKKHRKAKKTQPGRTFRGRKYTRLRLSFVDSEQEMIGWFNTGTIFLRKNDPTIARCLATKNQEAITIAAMAILSAYDTFTVSDRQAFLPDVASDLEPADRFARKLGSVTSKGVSIDGQDLTNKVADPDTDKAAE